MGRITLDKVSKSFGDVQVIPPLDLTIDDGEFTVFVGPSGCGKSTLLRLIAGLEDVTSGQIRIDKQDATYVPPAKRGLAMVFQSYALYPHMSVRKNIAFPMKMAKVPVEEQNRRIEAAANALNLSDYLDRRPGQLSGGQRQRVAIGRAIVREPSAFLFDEPLSNLDAKLREKLRTEIRKMHLQLKTTTIFVTHDQLEAMTIADRIVLMRDGKIEQLGSPDEIFERPATRFVADFIGTPAMNFLHATIEDGHIARAGGIALRLSPGAFPSLRPGQQVELGLRPARMELCPEGTPGALTGTVVLVENMGAEGQVITDVEGHEMSFTTPAFRGLAIGDRVSFAIDPDHIHAFDPQSGQSLRKD
ncbi:ABC transporter ATP-binding protein [Leisingera sp. F5]|uniref:ABC transporter ATP-binding protein n=1 Tax=Leisingera sp. F5 TaxID=1813816 RepID=UPI000A9AB048|nr:sn-glycerol-3-phosphate ABC transporter ATP-binding protein UgpC [Leisingera sp. F5]